MMEYRVVVQNISSVFTRDVDKASAELSAQVNALLAEGWKPQGGLSTVQAGAGIYLLQAMTRDQTG